MKLPNNIVGNTALYYVCYKLSARGWNVMPTTKNTAGIDAVCINRDGSLKRTIQVKGLTLRPAVPLGLNLDKIMGDFWVIVNSLGSDQPRTYILLPDEVRRLAVRNRSGKKAYWLPKRHYAMHEYEEQWQRIGEPLA